MTNVPNKQNAGKYETALYDCENTLAELCRLKQKVGRLGLGECHALLDKAEDMINEVYRKLYALQ